MYIETTIFHVVYGGISCQSKIVLTVFLTKINLLLNWNISKVLALSTYFFSNLSFTALRSSPSPLSSFISLYRGCAKQRQIGIRKELATEMGEGHIQDTKYFALHFDNYLGTAHICQVLCGIHGNPSSGPREKEPRIKRAATLKNKTITKSAIAKTCHTTSRATKLQRMSFPISTLSFNFGNVVRNNSGIYKRSSLRVSSCRKHHVCFGLLSIC